MFSQVFVCPPRGYGRHPLLQRQTRPPYWNAFLFEFFLIPFYLIRRSCYRPKRSFGQGNIFTPVCHSFCSQGGRQVPAWSRGGGGQAPPGSRHPPGADTPHEQTPRSRHSPRSRHPPGSRHPPAADIPPEKTPPPSGSSRLRNMVNARPVRILLECILVNRILDLKQGACLNY